MIGSKRTLVTLPLATHERVEAFRARHDLSLSTAMKLLIIEGLDNHAAALGEAPIARPFCGCDSNVTCAAAFNRKHEGACRLTARLEPSSAKEAK